jgi:hypothetical protein
MTAERRPMSFRTARRAEVERAATQRGLKPAEWIAAVVDDALEAQKLTRDQVAAELTARARTQRT